VKGRISQFVIGSSGCRNIYNPTTSFSMLSCLKFGRKAPFVQTAGHWNSHYSLSRRHKRRYWRELFLLLDFPEHIFVASFNQEKSPSDILSISFDDGWESNHKAASHLPKASIGLLFKAFETYTLCKFNIFLKYAPVFGAFALVNDGVGVRGGSPLPNGGANLHLWLQPFQADFIAQAFLQ